MLKKVLSVLNMVSQSILVLTALLSLFTAYVVFAPDDLPKPFRLLYNTGETPAQPTFGAVVVITATPAPEPKEYHPGEGIMVDMSTKIINLLDPAGRKYIRLTLVVEIAPENPDYHSLPEEEKAAYLNEFQTEIGSRMPIMDDTVITLLSTKTYEQLYTADGKENLRQEIVETLRQRLPDLHIISIYFTEFVVQ